MYNRSFFQRPPINPLILTLSILLLALMAPPVSSQICGDADCSGDVDISDMSAVIDYFVVSGAPPCNYDNFEFDRHANVNNSDFLEFLEWYPIVFPPPNGCLPSLPPLSTVSVPGVELAIEYTPDPSPIPHPDHVRFKLVARFPENLKALTVVFQVKIAGMVTQIIPGSVTSKLTGVRVNTFPGLDANTLMVNWATTTGLLPGRHELFQFDALYWLSPDPLPVTMELVPFPTPTNPHTGDPAYQTLFIFGGAGARQYVLPAVVSVIPCCEGLTGNVDCDALNAIDISDLTALIDNLYITFTPLCCKAEANCDGSLDGNVDIADLTVLIDFLYITFTTPAACP